MYKKIVIFIAFLILCWFSIGQSLAIENDACFMCHSKPDFKKVLPNGEVIDLHVSKEQFNQSVHKGRFSCYWHGQPDNWRSEEY